MRNLPNSLPVVYKAFMNGEFAVQIQTHLVVTRRAKPLRILSTEVARQKGDSKDSAQTFRRPKDGFSIPHEEVLIRRLLENS